MTPIQRRAKRNLQEATRKDLERRLGRPVSLTEAVLFSEDLEREASLAEFMAKAQGQTTERELNDFLEQAGSDA